MYIQACDPIVRSNHILDNHVGSLLGGGVWIGAPFDTSIASAPLIEGNTFEQNSATNGGELTVLDGSPTIRDNLFLHNTSVDDGAGMFIITRRGSPVVEHNTFQENEAGDHGGGAYFFDRSQSESITVSNNLFIRNLALGLGNGDTGSGGGIFVSQFRGTIVNNTLISNEGYGETSCSGGGILVDDTPNTLVIEKNIIVENVSCGIACAVSTKTSFLTNLFWMNQDGSLGSQTHVCPAAWAQYAIEADPLFCDAGADDYTLASNSPAIGMGAFPDPGCGPVAVQPKTWGRLKSKY